MTIQSPEYKVSTMCRLSLYGKSNSDLNLSVSGNKSICIPKGQIKLWRNYEWYDETKSVIIEQIDTTVESVDITLVYQFSDQYFGKNVGEGYIRCE